MSQDMDKDSYFSESFMSEANAEFESWDNKNDMKNISPYMSKNLIAAAGFNVQTPIVNALIGNLSGSLPTKKSEGETIKCEICDCELSSTVVLNFHLNGSKHKKRLKALEIIEQLRSAKDKGIQILNSDNPNAFRCEICSVTVNSAQQLEVHLSGSKHKKKLAKAGGSELESNGLNRNYETAENTDHDLSPSPAKKQKKDEPRLLSCDICSVFMNSPTQYDQHLVSKKHMSKVSGEQQKRRSLGRGRFIKFPQFRSRALSKFPSSENVIREQPQSQASGSRLAIRYRGFQTPPPCEKRRIKAPLTPRPSKGISGLKKR